MYKRKTKDEYQIHIDYGFGHGWEFETSELTYRDGLKQLKTYRENIQDRRLAKIRTATFQSQILTH